MIDCQSLRAFQILKSLKFFCMVTILNLKNLTAGIYPLLLLCRQTFPQLKDSVFKNFSMVSWCFQVCSWPDISYFIFFFFFWSSHLITSLGSCCVSFTPHHPFLVTEQNLNIAVIEETPIYFGVHDQIKYFKIKTPLLHNPGTLPNLKTNTRKWNLWKYHFWEWLLLKKSFLLRKELSWRKICWSWGRSWVCPSPIQSLFCLPLFLSLLGWAALQKTKLSWMLIFERDIEHLCSKKCAQ